MTLNSIDKNDVDISELFSWGKKVTIQDALGENVLELHMRLLGDADLNRARVYGLKESGKLRQKLREKDSDERLAYIPDIPNAETENLIELIINYSIRDITTEVSKDIFLKYPKEPSSDAKLEEQENHQKEIDEYPEKRKELIRKELENRVEQERERLNSLPRSKIEKIYEDYLINKLCQNKMYESFLDMCAYLGTYRDKYYGVPAFNDFESYLDLPTYVKEQFRDLYLTLDIDMPTLKK